MPIQYGGGSASIATTSTAGIVKPDGNTISVDGTGKIIANAAALGLYVARLSVRAEEGRRDS